MGSPPPLTVLIPHPSYTLSSGGRSISTEKQNSKIYDIRKEGKEKDYSQEHVESVSKLWLTSWLKKLL